MKNLLMAVGGAIVGVTYVSVIGLFSVQAIGLRAGAVLDLSNTVVGITEPRVPFWPLLATVVLSAVVVVAAVGTRGVLPSPARASLVAGFALASVALVVRALVLASRRDLGSEQIVGVLSGWDGWVEKGGLSSATHLVVVLAVASLWLRSPARVRPTPDAAATSVA